MNIGTIARSLISLFYSSSPRLSYAEDGRSGYIYYQDGFTDISFYYEFGGGDCQLCIDIPDKTNWEKETNTPLSRRDEILNFVGKNVINDKYSFGRRYEIGDDWLNIY
jgi:hypothetical protein